MYRQRAAGDIADDPLASIELSAEHFQADALSLLDQDLGAADTREVRRAISDLRPFFAAKDRTTRFKSIMPHAATGRDVTAGVLAASLGRIDPSSQSIILSYAAAALVDAEAGEDGRTLASIDRFGAGDALRRCVLNMTGYAGDVADAEALASHLLLSALSASVPEDLMSGMTGYSRECGRFCLGIVHELSLIHIFPRSRSPIPGSRSRDESRCRGGKAGGRSGAEGLLGYLPS